jgi:predicted metalloprotease with PDZ domain
VRKGIVGAWALASSVWGIAGAPALAAQAPVSDLLYEVGFNRETAAEREIHVEMSFDVRGEQPVLLSLPRWTPGSYSLDEYARNVSGFQAEQDGSGIDWDKADFDTWRVHPSGAGRVTVAFDYAADALDNGEAWSQPDFTFFNGTNLFLFPEGAGLDFPSRVSIRTEPEWRVASGLTHTGGGWEYAAETYHELVDMPTFVGRFDLDSLSIGGKWYRLASYPQGALVDQPRALLWDQIEAMMPPMEAVFDDVPWERYTTLLVFEPSFGGGSALEHSNSHLGIYNPNFRGTPTLASITAHEIFHAWNVKRLRPSDLWPYDYSEAMPTELLWISEGITDYYADLALVRGGIVPPELFYATTQGKISNVSSTVPVALEDASLSAWIGPRDGTASIYYDKGSLAGLLLDILIRDASDNRGSLDDVLRAVYERAYLEGDGFTEEQWWAAVRQAAGGRAVEDFHEAYVDGRQPYPWDQVLPLAGLALRTDAQSVPRIGITSTDSQEGTRVVGVAPGSSADAAGVLAGDLLVSVGDIQVEDVGFGLEFRARFADRAPGTSYPVVVNRAGELVTLTAQLQFAEVTNVRLEEDPAAGEKARRIRSGLLTGATGG